MNRFRKGKLNMPAFDDYLAQNANTLAKGMDNAPSGKALRDLISAASESEAYKKAAAVYNLTLNDDVRVNDKYQVNIDWDCSEHDCLTPSDDMKVVHLSIKRLDKQAIMDYRDLMTIKDELVGEDYEALMLYPARSREVDTSNQYHLWIPMLKDDEPVVIPFGWDDDRVVWDESKMGATQRPFKTEE